jgi:MscS family membrane protein
MMRFGFVLLIAWSLFAQTDRVEEKKSADPRFTPRSAIFGFLEACSEGNYRRAASFLNVQRTSRKAPDREELARQFRDILDRKLRSDPGLLSNAPEGDLSDGLAPEFELLGSVRIGDRPVDLLLERVQVEETSLWLVSSGTVNVIEVIHDDLDSSWIESRVPAWMRTSGPLNTAVWQWFALILLCAAVYAVATLLARMMVAVTCPIVRRTTSNIDDEVVRSLGGPLEFLVGLLLFRSYMDYLEPSILLRTYLARLLTGLIYLAIAWVAVRVIDVIAAEFMARMSRRQRATVSSVTPLMRRTFKIAAILMAILATLSSWGYNTTAILAGLGVGGLAVALAAQKTIENLFGGVAITTDRPVLVGDFCRYGDKLGIVEDIGLRSTRVRTLDRTVVTVPNAEFSSLQIENFGRRDKIFFHPILSLRRDTTAEQMRTLIASFRQVLLNHPKVDPDPARVRFIAIGTYSFDIEIFAYVKTTDMNEFLLVQEEVLLQLLDAIEAAGTGLAVPVQMNLRQQASAQEPGASPNGR